MQFLTTIEKAFLQKGKETILLKNVVLSMQLWFLPSDILYPNCYKSVHKNAIISSGHKHIFEKQNNNINKLRLSK